MLRVSLFLSPVRIVALNQNQVVETLCICTHANMKKCNRKQKKNRTLIYQTLIKVGHNKQVGSQKWKKHCINDNEW